MELCLMARRIQGGAGFEAVVGAGEPQFGGDTGGDTGGIGRAGGKGLRLLVIILRQGIL